MTASSTTAPDGVEVAVEHLGTDSGNPTRRLVCTTGWANERSVWSALADDLAADHAVTTWDLRGHGDSGTPPPGNYSRQHALGDLAAVLDGAGRPAVLVGHSLGGYLSLAHTLDHPDDVAGLVLVATGPGFRKAEAREEWNASVRAAAAKMDQAAGVEEISLHVDSHVIDHLADIACPVLVLLGERDRRFAASAALFERDLDVRATVVVPDQGHMVHLKAAAECAAAIREFTAGL
ncbi:MAG: alpha/beta hydrolase [Acidimicrobiales bacterium]|jgi:pimeloyl-ACP methyl ester carboxylesterase|nr:alpha/beta hydrolase [Acidimicrobiales bacterium]